MPKLKRPKDKICPFGCTKKFTSQGLHMHVRSHEKPNKRAKLNKRAPAQESHAAFKPKTYDIFGVQVGNHTSLRCANHEGGIYVVGEQTIESFPDLKTMLDYYTSRSPEKLSAKSAEA